MILGGRVPAARPYAERCWTPGSFSDGSFFDRQPAFAPYAVEIFKDRGSSVWHGEISVVLCKVLNCMEYTNTVGPYGDGD
jgi:hypothetical protein